MLCSPWPTATSCHYWAAICHDPAHCADGVLCAPHMITSNLLPVAAEIISFHWCWLHCFLVVETCWLVMGIVVGDCAKQGRRNVNSLRPSHAHNVHHKNKPSLDQIMACHLFCVKPLSVRSLATNFREFDIKYNNFHSKQLIWKSILQNDSHFMLNGLVVHVTTLDILLHRTCIFIYLHMCFLVHFNLFYIYSLNDLY